MLLSISRNSVVHLSWGIVFWCLLTKSCPTLCDPVDCSPPGSSVRRISQTRIPSLSCVGLFVTPWTVACQVSPSMGFSRQEYWSGSPFPSPGDLPNPGTEPVSPALAGRFFTTEPPKVSFFFFPTLWFGEKMDMFAYGAQRPAGNERIMIQIPSH